MAHAPDNYGSYGSVPTVSDSGGGGTPMGVRANPDDFGAGIGKAVQNLGDTGEQVANKFSGMIAETQATNAETEYMTKLGAITGSYRSKEGLAAVDAFPQYQADVANLRQTMVASLPSGQSQQAFNMLALRHEGYALSDGANYSSTQVKSADRQSAVASTQVAISNSGSLTTAVDDKRFEDNLHDINFGNVRQMQSQGWDVGTGMKMDPKSGQVSFDDSENGRRASSVYGQMMDKTVGEAWNQRLRVLADQNVHAAYQKYEDNRDRIPGEAQAKLDAFFTPKLKDYESRSVGDDIINSADTAYTGKLTGGKVSGDIADAIHQQESSGKPHDYQIQPDTFTQYAKPGEAADRPADQDAVYGRIIDDLKKSYPNDPARQAVAYFSGKGNVAPAGSATPYIADRQDAQGKSTSSYVSDITGRLGKQAAPATETYGPSPQAPQLYQSKADYYRDNYVDLVSGAEKKAQDLHPDDPAFAQLVRARVETRLNDEIRQQTKAYRADSDLINQAADGSLTKGNIPSSMDELANSDPRVKTALDRAIVQQPEFYRALQTNITGRAMNAHGPHYSAVQDRLFLPPSDPNAITDQAQLWPLVADHQITLKDRKDFADTLEKMNDPTGKMEETLKKQGLDTVLDGIVPKSMRSKGLYSPEQAASLQNATIAFQQADKEAITNGKSAAQRYNTTSNDFVGKSASAFMPTPADRMKQTLDTIPKNFGFFDAVQGPIPEAVREDMARRKIGTPAPAAEPSPVAGDIKKGYRFKGGNPADKNSWEKQ